MNKLAPHTGDPPVSKSADGLQATPIAPAAAPRFPWRRSLVALLVVVGMGAFAVTWTRSSYTYVHETDARIKADLITVSSDAEGRMIERLVKEGDPVSAGDILARIDDREARIRLEETEAEADAILAEMDRLDAEIALVLARVESRIKSRGAELDETRARRTLLETEFDYAKSEFDRATALANSGTLSKQRLDRVRTDFVKARQDLNRARAEIAMSEASVAEARADLSEIAVKKADSERLASRFTEISARRKRLQIDIDDRTIRSPIDGVVGRTFVIAGEHVEEGQRLLSLHDPDDVWVQANVRETDLGRVEVGQKVKIAVDAYPDNALVGRVERIGRAANSEYALLPRLNEAGTFTKVTQRIELRINLEQPEATLKPGMMVVIDIEAPRPAPWPLSLLVPEPLAGSPGQ